MSSAQFRWLLIALAGVLVGYVVVRRRRLLVEALPQPLIEQAERFVIPWSSAEQSGEATPTDETPDSEGQGLADAAEEDETEDVESVDSSRRKVSASYRISYSGRRYGPLPAALVGQYVEIENSNGKLFVLHEGTPVASFDLLPD